MELQDRAEPATLQATVTPLHIAKAASAASPATAAGRAETRSEPVQIQAAAAATAMADSAVWTRAWAAMPVAPWSKAAYSKSNDRAATSSVAAREDFSAMPRSPARTNVPGRAIWTVDIGWRS